MSMNSHFGEWYRSAGIPPETIPLEKRWEVIDSFGVGAGNTILLTQIFYQLSLTDASFSQTFRTAFNKVDPNFKMSGNDRELIVLAGAELVDAMERSARNIADFAALCLVCAGAQNLRVAPAIQHIPEIAAKYLSKRSLARAKPEEEDGKEETEIKKLLLEFPIVKEESNMLWWLISETSRDVDKRWSEMPLGMVCTMTAKELADLSQIIPGPIAARAFLDRAVRSGRDEVAASISITNVVNDTEEKWRNTYFSKALSNGLEGILPLTQAVTLSVQSSTAWRSMFKATTGIGATTKGSPDLLAYQFYLEQLTARSFNEMKES